MSIKIASMNFGDCDTILHNTPNGMKNIAKVLGPNGEVYWSSIKELTGIPPLSIRSNGTMLLDYLISGNMTLSGTPTPTTPIQPQECGERTENLSIKSTFSNVGTDTRNFFQIQVNFYSNNSYVGNSAIQNIYGTGAKQYTFDVNIANVNKISIKHNGSNNDITIEYIEGNFNGKYTISFDLLSNNPTIKGGLKLSNIMLNAGSTALPYEPYGYKLDISSANTTTPIYLGEVPTTRRIRKLVLDGTENWTYRSGDPANVFFMYLPTAKTGEVAISNAYPYYSGTDFVDMNDKEFAIIRSNLAIRNSNYQYESQFKTYLAQQYANGTPVCVWYVLATPETAVVNEPLRKIGDYADTVSYEQAGVQIPTLHGNTVIDVETTLKPSQMYIKYK